MASGSAGVGLGRHGFRRPITRRSSWESLAGDLPQALGFAGEQLLEASPQLVVQLGLGDGSPEDALDRAASRSPQAAWKAAQRRGLDWGEELRSAGGWTRRSSPL